MEARLIPCEDLSDHLSCPHKTMILIQWTINYDEGFPKGFNTIIAHDGRHVLEITKYHTPIFVILDF